MKTKRKASSQARLDIIGWREMVGLPDLGIMQIRAKIDTGARTSALHAEKQELFERDGVQWVRFLIPTGGHPKLSMVETPLRDERDIDNTSGMPERRYIVRTTLLLGRHRWHIDVSLADRLKMEFDLILGRTAIRGRNVLVDSGGSYLAGNPKGKRLQKQTERQPKIS